MGIVSGNRRKPTRLAINFDEARTLQIFGSTGPMYRGRPFSDIISAIIVSTHRIATTEQKENGRLCAPPTERGGRINLTYWDSVCIAVDKGVKSIIPSDVEFVVTWLVSLPALE